jgi:DNA-binding NarL/FixJ family response regulator
MTKQRNALQVALDRLDEQLTERQRQVAGLVEQGLTNEEIGAELGISARTVKAHTDVIRQKLGVRRRRQIPPALRERERRSSPPSTTPASRRTSTGTSRQRAV